MYKMTSKNYIPIRVYPGGNTISVNDLPSNTVFKWIDPLGGNKLPGPITWDTIRPDGKRAHNSIMTYDDNNNPVVECYGYK